MDSGQESNLTSILGNVSQSEKLFEIKLPFIPPPPPGAFSFYVMGN